MLYVYAVAAAAAVPLLNNFFPILRQQYSVWLVPLLFIGIFLGLTIIHLLFFVICGAFINMKKPAGERTHSAASFFPASRKDRKHGDREGGGPFSGYAGMQSYP